MFLITKPATAGIVTGLTIMNPINTAGTGHGASILLHSTQGAPDRGVKIASSSTRNFALNNDMVFYELHTRSQNQAPSARNALPET